MNTRRCLQIADLLNELLLRELGEGVDGLRMVAEPLCARDVLLVCDAMPGTELAVLSQQYRIAASEQLAAEVQRPHVDLTGGSGVPRRWFSPSRRLGDR